MVFGFPLEQDLKMEIPVLEVVSGVTLVVYDEYVLVS